MDKMKLETPTLYSVSSKKKIKEWTISVESNGDGTATIIREHGYVGATIQRNERVVRKGKNIGKVNETSPYEQAVSEALSKRQKRIDTGYTEEIPDLDNFNPPELPMLAQPFTKRKHNIEYPCFVQPKLNGVRCFAKKVDENTIIFTSRKGKKYDTLDHLAPALLATMKVGQILDGEIYIHGKTFQHIVRLVKKLRPESITLQFHAYDWIDTNHAHDYASRKAWLDANLGQFSEIVNTRTLIVHNEDQVYDAHDEFVKEGYEGVIIRNSYGDYKFDNRSADLQKYKKFFDEEYEIIGGRSAEGNQVGCVVFKGKVILNDGTEDDFDVSPRGSFEQRREYLEDIDNLIGKELTVRYQEKSEDGVPIFPVGIVVRDYE